MKEVAILAGLCAFSFLSTGSFRLPFPGPEALRSPPEKAVADMTALNLGLRRLGADLEFIRLLQYYGSPESQKPHEHEEGQRHLEGGVYADVLPRALRLLSLDPYFSHAALFSAGALAFNLERPEEAILLLRAALERHPEQWRYHAYLAAIGYHKAKDPTQVVRLLEPFVWEGDCPTLVKNVVGFLMRKASRWEEAERVYRNILATTQDPGYKEIAERALKAIPQERKKTGNRLEMH